MKARQRTNRGIFNCTIRINNLFNQLDKWSIYHRVHYLQTQSEYEGSTTMSKLKNYQKFREKTANTNSDRGINRLYQSPSCLMAAFKSICNISKNRRREATSSAWSARKESLLLAWRIPDSTFTQISIYIKNYTISCKDDHFRDWGWWKNLRGRYEYWRGQDRRNHVQAF